MDIRKFLRSLIPWSGRNVDRSEPAEQIVFDSPIADAAHDLLERSPVANRIAQILAAPAGADGRVFAIRGAWGFGKSSLKNLVIEALAERSPSALVLDFNPWQWGDSDAISRALFTQMADKLGGPRSRDAIKRAGAMRTYGGLLVGGGGKLDKFGHNTKGVTALLVGAAAIAAAFGLTIPGITPKALSAVIITLSLIAILVGQALNWFGRDITKDALDVVRSDIQKLLESLHYPLIVFVDDIDRLEPEQIRLVIRQIKANANLPNINFVLLYQPSIVEAALAPVASGNGRDYLEKIVQASFDLPPVEGDRLYQIFLSQLAALVDPLAVAENGFDQTRWGNVLFGGIQPMIRNLRDSKRLLASIAIHIEMHKGPHALEVNIIDFIALEALRVFEPAFHNALAAHKSLLTTMANLTAGRREESDRAEIAALLNLVTEDRQSACTRLFKELFTTVEWAMGGMYYTHGDFTREWLRNKRVCTERNFDRYFALQISGNVISESDFTLLLQSMSDAEAFALAVAALAERGLLPALAQRLDQSVSELPVDCPINVLSFIFTNGERLGRQNSSPLNDFYLASWRSAIWYLARLPDSSARREAFSAAFLASDAMAVPATILSIEKKALAEPDPQRPPNFDAADLEALTTLWLVRMEEHATDVAGQLAQPDLIARLFRWKDFGGDEAPRDWATTVGSNPETVVGLLRGFLNRGLKQSIEDLVATPTESFHHEHFDVFVAPDVILATLSNLDKSALPPEDIKLIEMFERQAKRWQKRDTPA